MRDAHPMLPDRVVPAAELTAAYLRTEPIGPSVVIVDDDPNVIRGLTRLLGSPFEIHTARSVAEAQELLELLSRVDLAFVDLELPDATGHRVLHRLLAWPDSVRVLMSGNLERVQELHGYGPLVHLILTKPLASSAIQALKQTVLSLS